VVTVELAKESERFLSENTRFWNASGIDVSLDANGSVSIRSRSYQ
jgi:paraquat-inducible protein B